MKRKILFPLLSIFLGFFVITVFLEIVFNILPVQESLKKLPVNSTNPIIRFQENRDAIWSNGPLFDIVAKKHINNYGFLNDQDYSPEDDSPLMAIIGDSFVEACQVENRKSMHGILSQQTAGKGRVYSFGSSGSPLSTYLAYSKYVTKNFKADAHVFIIIGNDYHQSLFKYKNSPGYHYFMKKQDRLVLERIDFRSSLLKRLLRNSALIRYLALNAKLN